MRSSSSRSSVLGEMIQLICHIFGSLRSINVLTGDKFRSSVLVPVGPYNCVVLHFAPFFFSSLFDKPTCWIDVPVGSEEPVIWVGNGWLFSWAERMIYISGDGLKDEIGR